MAIINSLRQIRFNPDKNVSWAICTPYESIAKLSYHTNSLPHTGGGNVMNFAFDYDYPCEMLTLKRRPLFTDAYEMRLPSQGVVRGDDGGR